MLRRRRREISHRASYFFFDGKEKGKPSTLLGEIRGTRPYWRRRQSGGRLAISFFDSGEGGGRKKSEVIIHRGKRREVCQLHREREKRKKNRLLMSLEKKGKVAHGLLSEKEGGRVASQFQGGRVRFLFLLQKPRRGERKAA